MRSMSKTKDQKDSKAPQLPSELLTKKELAQRLRISPRKIELNSEMPCIRWGRNVRYDWQEVIGYLKGQNG